MPFTLKMPKLSPTMEEGTISKWHKKVGDRIKAGDVLFEVATDKATVEYNSLDDGFLRKIIVNDGGEAKVNQPIAVFTETENESIEGYVPQGLAATPKETPKETSETKPSVATTPITQAPTAGKGLEQPAFVPAPPLESYTYPFPSESDRVAASPLARKLAKDKGIDLTTIKGTGPQGRIVSRDLELGTPSGNVAFGKREIPELPPGTYEEETLTPMRKIIGQRLQQSKTFVPHFYVSQDIQADALHSIREQLKTDKVKVSINDFIVRACALSLREHPEVNSGFNTVQGALIRFKTIDISIAVSVPAGLITPIVRHADYKNLGQISAEVKQLAIKARDGKLAREEYIGGSFTISNLGMFGVSEFAAIINPPQAAILAVSGIEEKPIVKDGVICIGKVMRVTLSADHRVIDGSDGAKFLKTVQKYLENPALLLI